MKRSVLVMKYISNPWMDYCSDEIRDYLKNTRHLTSPNSFSIIDCRFPEEANKLSISQGFTLRNTILEKCEIDDILKFQEMFSVFYFIEESVKVSLACGEVPKETVYEYLDSLDLTIRKDVIQGIPISEEKLVELIEYFHSFWHLLSVFQDLDSAAKNIYKRIGFGESAPDIKWVSDLEKRSECVEINGQRTLVLSYSQVVEFVKIIISSELTNEDSLDKFEEPLDEIEKFISRKPEEIMKQALNEGVTPLALIEYMFRHKVNFEIIIPHIYSSLADLFYVYGYMDGAFHYMGQAAAIQRKKQPIQVRTEIESCFKRGGLQIWETIMTTSIATFLMAHEIHHVELTLSFKEEKQTIGLLDRLYVWAMTSSHVAYDTITDMWTMLTQPIQRRSMQMINELKEELVNDEAAFVLLEASTSAIMSWSYMYNIFLNIQETIENRCDLKEPIQGLLESYCDIMALYDVLLEESECKLEDVFCAIDSIIRSLAIQEANHIMVQMLKFAIGEVNEIKSLHLKRLQFFVIGILNEWLVLNDDKLHDDCLIKVDWRHASESFAVNNNDSLDMNKVFSFDVLRRFSNTPNFKEKVYDYFVGMLEGLDEIHEYYYQSVIYTFFHSYQDGYITKDFKGIYLKYNENDPNGLVTARLDIAAVTNAITHDEMVKNINEAIKKEKANNSDIEITEMDKMMHIKNTDEILKLYSLIHDNRMITDEDDYINKLVFTEN